jgi:hypothetical protein
LLVFGIDGIVPIVFVVFFGVVGGMFSLSSVYVTLRVRPERDIVASTMIRNNRKRMLPPAEALRFSMMYSHKNTLRQGTLRQDEVYNRIDEV